MDIFQKLIEERGSWSALRDFLQSEEGGSLRVQEEIDGQTIIRYVKNQSDFTKPWVSWFRSVVWDTVKNRPLCIAPPKASTEVLPTGGLIVEDFIEGMMVNVYKRDGVLKLATRSRLDAAGTFYNNKTFAKMFYECLHSCNLGEKELLALLDSDSTFASFVVSHPDHKLVANIQRPTLHLVQKGHVSENGVFTFIRDEQCVFMRPCIYPISGYASIDDLTHHMMSLASSNHYGWQGIVLHTQSFSQRWRFITPGYKYIRDMRGAESSEIDRFLRLRREGKVKEYLYYYPEFSRQYWEYETNLRQMTESVYISYCDVHKFKKHMLQDVCLAIQPFVFRLHAQRLAAPTKAIQMKDAIALVNASAVYEVRRLMTMSCVE